MTNADPHPDLLADRDRLARVADRLLRELDAEDDGNAVMAQVVELEAAMAAMPATTPAGALALARLARDLLQGRVGGDPAHDDVVILAALVAVENVLEALAESDPGVVRH